MISAVDKAEMYGRAIANQINYYTHMYGIFHRDTLKAIQAAEFDRISTQVSENCLEPAEKFQISIWDGSHFIHAETHREYIGMTPPGQEPTKYPKDEAERVRIYADAYDGSHRGRPMTPRDQPLGVFPEINSNLGVIWHAIWDERIQS